MVIVFPFFRKLTFSTYFFDFMWSSSKVFRDIKAFWTVHLRPFIRYQGKNLDLFWLWCCFQFFLHCLVQPNKVIHFLFHIIFIIRIRLWVFQSLSESTCTLYDSEISLFKVFINACKLTVEIQNWLELFPWCFTLIVSVYNRLKFFLIINTSSLSLTKI